MRIRHTVVTILLTLTVTFGAFYGSVQAGLFDAFMTSDWQTRTHDAHYQLEAYGFDARAYEWTPLANPDWTCVFVASNESSGSACYPKATAE